MGAQFARDLAGMLKVEEGVRVHLRHNFYPAHPSYMLPIALEAIKAVNDDNADLEIKLPKGTLFRGEKTAPAHLIVESMRLDAWIIQDDLDY